MRDADSNQFGRDPNATVVAVNDEFAAKKAVARGPFDNRKLSGAVRVSRVGAGELPASSGDPSSGRSFVRSVHSGAIRMHRSSESGTGDNANSGQ